MTSPPDNVAESLENIRLTDGRKNRKLCDEDCLTGAKFINVAFATLTAIITAALLLQIYYGDYQVVPHGSVATDSLECSKIGTETLKNGGNAVDAAIAAVFCLAVVTPHLTSLDADVQVLSYSHRQRAPADAIVSPSGVQPGSNLPRLVSTMAYLHREYGSRPWSQLVAPSVAVARNGFLVSKMLVEAVQAAAADDLYGRLEAGQLLQLQLLADTLQEIGRIPEKTLYEYVTDNNNSPHHSQAQSVTFAHFDVYVAPAPTIGPYFLTALNQLDAFNFTLDDATFKQSQYLYRMAEVLLQLYESQQLTTKYHVGVSTHVAVMDLDDNYVALSTGLSGLFGSAEMTTKGYILDNRLNGSAQYAYLPIIATDASAICGRRLALGANDLSLATQILLDLLVANENASVALEAPRFHLLNNDSIGIEANHSPLFSEELLQYLETLTPKPLLVPEPYMSSNVVEKTGDDLNSHSDSRGGGIASRF